MLLKVELFHSTKLAPAQQTKFFLKISGGFARVEVTAGKPFFRGLLNNLLCSKRAHSAGRSELVSG